jgi:hypothetical protein
MSRMDRGGEKNGMAETLTAPAGAGPAPSAGAEMGSRTTGASPTTGTSTLTDEQILGIDGGEMPGTREARTSQSDSEWSGDGEPTEETQPNDAARQDDEGRAEDARRERDGAQPQKGLTPEIREFFKTHPEIRDAYFRSQEYARLFPDFKTAEMVASHLAQYENAAELSEDLKGVADLKALDRMFYSGDAGQHGKIVENLFTDSPEAFGTLLEALPETLERLANDAARPVLAAKAQRFLVEGNTRAFERVLDWQFRKARAEGNQELAKKLEGVAEAVLGRSPWGPESVDAKLGKLRIEQLRIEEQKQQSRAEAATRWVNEANESVVREFTGAVKQTVEQLVGRAYSDEAKRLLVGEIYRRVHQSLEKNQDLIDHVNALTRGGAGDPRAQRQIVRLVSNQAKRMIPGVAERVIGAFGQGTLAATDQKQKRENAAAGRVDVTGSAGMEARGVKATTPAQLKQSGKYRVLSDDDILDGRG